MNAPCSGAAWFVTSVARCWLPRQVSLEAGAVLGWEWQVTGHDVGFQLTFRPSDGSDAVVVVPSERRDKHEGRCGTACRPSCCWQHRCLLTCGVPTLMLCRQLHCGSCGCCDADVGQHVLVDPQQDSVLHRR